MVCRRMVRVRSHDVVGSMASGVLLGGEFDVCYISGSGLAQCGSWPCNLRYGYFVTLNDNIYCVADPQC